MNAKNPFTLKYLSGVVIKFEILMGNMNVTDLRPLLPTSIKTFLNGIKPCCLFRVVNSFLVNYSHKIEVYKKALECAEHENHSDCIEYINNCSEFYNQKIGEIVMSYSRH